MLVPAQGPAKQIITGMEYNQPVNVCVLTLHKFNYLTLGRARKLLRHRGATGWRGKGGLMEPASIGVAFLKCFKKFLPLVDSLQSALQEDVNIMRFGAVEG